MHIKEKKYYLILSRNQLGQLIEYLAGARNSFIDKGGPTDDVDKALLCLLNFQRRHRGGKLGL